MKHPELQAYPIVLKLQGFDGVPTVKEPWDTWEPYDTPEEGCTFTVAGVEQSVRQLVGTRRYDVYQTMQCRRGTIVDLLVLAELATERDRTRAVYPATLFLALQDVCRGVVMSSSTKRRAIFPIDVAIESKNAVVDAFPARRQQMEERIWHQLGFGSLEGGYLCLLSAELRVDF
jgi:hypothetical protein